MNSRFRFHKTMVRFAAALSLAAAPTFAAAENPDALARTFRNEVLLHAGQIGIADREAADNFVSIEARLRHNWHGIRPWGGVTAVDSGAWFAGAGLIYDFALSEHTRLTLGSGPFYYTYERADDDLGLRLEFYSFAELSWELKRDVRLGVRVGHLSNAGLGRRNPGTETLSLVLSLPLDQLIASSDRH